MYTDLGGPSMAAKLVVFAAGVWIADAGACACGHSCKPPCQSVHVCPAAGIPRWEALHKIGYLLLGLPRLAVRLLLIKAHRLQLRLGGLLRSDEVFCDLIGRAPAAFVAYKADYLGSEHWKQLCAEHGLLPSGELPADQRQGGQAHPDPGPCG